MPAGAFPDGELAANLALAVIVSSNAPLILLDGEFVVLAASDSFCGAFDIDPLTVSGKAIFNLGNGEWDIPQLRSLLATTLSGAAAIAGYELDLNPLTQDARKLMLHAQKLDYGDETRPRILLALTDLTAARASERQKDELLREKAVLLQEIQHRVANSLQIIASVLIMSARKVQSAETRFHLQDAHSRVMSIAAVQRQLAVSAADTVKLNSYFKQLCESLGASMIHDRRQITIQVIVDDSIVEADTGISLGLIVTELVINALKHAFPGERIGKIVIDYKSYEGGWILSATDNGVGMPAKRGGVEPGLGTSIVEALASKLRAQVTIDDAHPGTAVSIVHSQGTGAAKPAA
ncbi:MAG TPA: sensor histidine kinase [Alphaproteobacteria bacterium]|nr:sensor histidine kinase [Alphaproteobacteria bacterium]